MPVLNLRNYNQRFNEEDKIYRTIFDDDEDDEGIFVFYYTNEILGANISPMHAKHRTN